MHPTTDKLLAIAAKVANLEPAKVLDLLRQPAQEDSAWWMHVQRDVGIAWEGLSRESRLVAFIQAWDRLADGYLRND